MLRYDLHVNATSITSLNRALMAIPLRHRLLVLSLTLGSFTPFVADDLAKPLVWWQVVTGILAIPAALLGLFYSYFLIRKTRLEARKLELDIREKERDLQLDRLRPKEVSLQGRNERLVGLSLMLAITVITTYIALFAETILLPITRSTRFAALGISVPTVAAQLMSLLLLRRPSERRPAPRRTPTWILAVPVVSVGCFAVVAIGMVTGDFISSPTPQTLLMSVSVSATLINVACVYLLAGGARAKKPRRLAA
jgi:hypothetical protein